MRWFGFAVLAVSATATAKPIIVDHTCTNPTLIPSGHINESRVTSNLRGD